MNTMREVRGSSGRQRRSGLPSKSWCTACVAAMQCGVV
jgi:hypothetical protein